MLIKICGIYKIINRILFWIFTQIIAHTVARLININIINNLPDGVFSPVDILENASNVSGKFGGVAGVLHGVIWKYKNSCL